MEQNANLTHQFSLRSKSSRNFLRTARHQTVKCLHVVSVISDNTQQNLIFYHVIEGLIHALFKPDMTAQFPSAACTSMVFNESKFVSLMSVLRTEHVINSTISYALLTTTRRQDLPQCTETRK